MDDKIEIVLATPSDAYNPGQRISGQVQCVFSKERKVKGVKVTFRGRSKTKWVVHYENNSIAYLAKEVYFQQEFDLAEGEGEIKLSAGSHSYPFSYTLPQELPSSFKGEHGEASYTIKAVVGCAWKFDYEDICVLKIIAPLNLNSMSELREPVAISLDENPKCCCCSSGPITFNVSLPVTGFVPGQSIKINCCVRNNSKEPVFKVVFRLMKQVECTTYKPSENIWSKSVALVTSHKQGVGPHNERSWTFNLQIPTNAEFENLTPCKLINILYRVQAELILPAQYKNPIIEIPITIGTVPLAGVHSNSNCNTYSSAPPSYAEVVEQKGRY